MSKQKLGVCYVCNEPIHYRYPCKCRRLTVQDIFRVTGKGYIITTRLEEDTLQPKDTIVFGEDERYVISDIERFRNSMGLSKNVGIQIQGDLKHDKNSYSGKTFYKESKM